MDKYEVEDGHLIKNGTLVDLEEFAKKLTEESMTAEDGNKRIADILKEVSSLITEAEGLADKFGLSFCSPLDHYGMGGAYYGEGCWAESGGSHGWVSSSEQC